jgi:hypothetical protein
MQKGTIVPGGCFWLLKELYGAVGVVLPEPENGCPEEAMHRFAAMHERARPPYRVGDVHLERRTVDGVPRLHLWTQIDGRRAAHMSDSGIEIARLGDIYPVGDVRRYVGPGAEALAA